MQVLYISYDGMTDPLGQSQVIPYLIGLSEKGYRFTIVSCEKKDRFDKQKQNISAILKINQIDWFPVPYSTLPSVLSKQWNLYKIKKIADTLCKRKKPGIIHCRSYMAALVGLQLKYTYGIKFIFDMRGFWADERIDGKIWNKNNILHRYFYNYFKKKEIEFLSNADYTITLTKKAKKEILGWKQFSGNDIPVQVIPCCVDLNLFSYKNIELSKRNQLKNKLQIGTEDFVVSYLGSTGTWYMLDEMLDFFKCLSEKKTISKFFFITPDSPNIILEKAELKGIPKEKIIVEFANRVDVPLYLSLSNVSLYFIKPVYSKTASSPTKTGEIMAMGIPIISNAGIGDIDEILSDKTLGLLVQDFTIDNYNRIINQLDLFLNPDKNKIADASNVNFSLFMGIELYYSVYKKLTVTDLNN